MIFYIKQLNEKKWTLVLLEKSYQNAA